MTNLEITREYLRAIEQSVLTEALARFFAPEAVHYHLPNLLFPKGARTDLKGMLEEFERV